MGFFKDLFNAIKEGLDEPVPEQENSALMQHKEETSKNIVFDQLAESIKDNVLFDCHKYGTDLVVFHDYGTGCCELCAKLRGRVYSISGNNKVFPKLPDYAKMHGNFHNGCRCTMTPYFGEEEIFYKGELRNAITISNRSWVDDRSDEEVLLYENYLNILAEQEQKEYDREEYENLLQILPEQAPKSFGAYRKMKKANTTNFQKLVLLAEEKGFYIDTYEE